MTDRLNFGCGSIQPERWVNVDRLPLGQPVTADLLEGLPFGDDTFAGAVAHHSLQQVRVEELVAALIELRRVLAPGAILRLTVPDIRAAIAAWQTGDRRWFPNDDGSHIDIVACAYLTWFGTNVTPLTDLVLVPLLARAGFSDVSVLRMGATLGPPWLTELDARADESIFMEAVA